MEGYAGNLMIDPLRSRLEDITLHANAPLYSTDGTPVDQKKVLSSGDGMGLNWTWTIYEAEFDGDNIMFFGLVNGDFPELGYFTLYDLMTDGVFADVSFDGVHPEEDDFATGGLDVSLN